MKPIDADAQCASRKASGGMWFSQVVSAGVLTALVLATCSSSRSGWR